ncbi:MAG TPA: AAA family ATPase [Dehalococcoidia bacterium]|nr:AAA family ATPase [Dehalococcoidia bacterium]
MADVATGSGFAISVLGRFELRHSGRLALDGSWSRRRALSLIKVLAVAPEHRLHREQLLELLWPEADPAAALNSLHKSLHYIRSALANRGVHDALVSLRGEAVGLAPGTEVDADRFRDLARRALAAGDTALLESATASYGGDLLPEDVFEDWTAAPREELRGLVAEVLLALARARAAVGGLAAAIEALQRLLRSDPLHEEAHLLLMELYAASGSRHRALRQYQALRDALRDGLQAEPSAAARTLYERLLGSSEPAGGEDKSLPLPSRGQARRPGPLLGREREMEAAESALEAAIGGAGRALFVSGEAGMGKTHLLGHVLAVAEESGCLVLSARCSHMEATVPYQPIRDVISLASGQPGAGEFVRHSLYLRRVNFESATGDETSREPHSFQSELFGEAHKLVQLLSRSQTLVLAFDDVHEADDETIRLLHFLARRIAAERVLLVCTFRSDEAEQQARLAELLTSLRRDRLTIEVDLAPLDQQSMSLLVEQLLAPGPVHPQLVREVISRAEGNPFFASEIVHTFVQEGWARLVDGRWERRGSGEAPVPSAVKDLLDMRLRRLSPTAQAELQLAAVYGKDIEFPLLSAALGLGEREALEALEECIEASVLEETPDGYKFRHDLLREAIYSGLTRARRQVLHRTIARLLEDAAARAKPSDADVEAVGRHYALSDEPAKGLGFLLDSARRAAAVYANDNAAVLYEQALTIARQHPGALDGAGLAGLLESLGDIERRRGRTAHSVDLFQEAAAVFAAAGDSEGATRARGKTALGLIMLGRADLAKELITSTLKDLTEQSPVQVVSRTYYLLAQLHWHSGEHRAALEAAERSLLAANAAGEPAEQAQAYEVMALACHSLGDWRRGVEFELARQALAIPGFNIDEAFEAHL